MLQLLNAWMIRQFSTDSSTADAEDKFKAALGSRAPYLLPHSPCDFHPLPSLSVIIRNTTKMALLDFTVVRRGYSQLCTSAVQFTSQFDSVVELIRIDSLWYKNQSFDSISCPRWFLQKNPQTGTKFRDPQDIFSHSADTAATLRADCKNAGQWLSVLK